jgi:hypothetical protein
MVSRNAAVPISFPTGTGRSPDCNTTGYSKKLCRCGSGAALFRPWCRVGLRIGHGHNDIAPAARQLIRLDYDEIAGYLECGFHI